MTMSMIYWFGLALLPLALLLYWFFIRSSRDKADTTVDLSGLASQEVIGDETQIDITDSTDSLYSEIELMIAYQDFEQASQKITHARQNDAEDAWLLMLELKLLASMHELEEFNRKFQQFQPLLSRIYPSAWVQMEVIHQKLNRTHS